VRHAEVVRTGVKIRREPRDDSPPLGCRYAVDYDLKACDLSLRLGGARAFRVAYLDGDFSIPILDRHW
jgi:hypothetical protein